MQFSKAILLASASIALTHQAASAQPAPPSAPDSSMGEPSTAGTDILVTARRREEQLERVPVSITAISGDALKRQNIVVANDLQFAVPGLTVTGVQGSREDPPISLRAQGQTFGGALPGVQSYFNEVPIPGSISSLYDMEGIQVLKGPQGTLFGRNTTGGAILYGPKRPTHDFEGYVMGRVGNLDLREIEGAINMPFGDKAALRVAGNILRRDGYTLDLTTGKKLDDQHRDNWRASLRIWPTETLTTDFLFQGYDINQNGGSMVLYDAPATGLVSAFFPFYQVQQYYVQQQANGPRATWTVPGFPHDFRRKHWFASNITTLELGGVTMKNIIALQETKRGFNTSYLGVPQPILFSEYSKKGLLNPDGELGGARQFSNELQFSGGSFGDRLKWVVGASYIQERPAGVVSDNLVTFGPPGGPFNPRSARIWARSKDYGIFAQGTYDLDAVADGLSITLGARYGVNKQSLAYTEGQQQTTGGVPNGQFQCTAIGLPANTPLADCVLRLERKFEKPSWNVSLEYQVTPSTLLYVAHRRGWKAGGFNPVAVSRDKISYGPETITDIEAGVKTNMQVSDGIVLRGSIAAYYAELKDIQRFSITVANNVTQALTQNAGDATIKGVELQAAVLFGRHFELSLNYAYTDPKITPLAAIGPSVGTSFAGVAKHAGSATARYTLPLAGDGGDLSLSATVYAQSRIDFVDTINIEPQAFQPSYALVNLRADWRGIMGTGLDAALFVNNVGKKLYAVDNIGLSSSIGMSARSYSAPRTYGAELRYRF